jgi:SAM-dependent methyltransferase
MGGEYSDCFKSLLSDEKKIGQLIQESGVGGSVEGKMPKFEDWERQRKFIAEAINRDGTILDIGCGSGFLLKCLLEWSDHRLIPYGIDNNPKRIELAKMLLPKYTNNIVEEKVESLDLVGKGLPKTFDFVYWNVWSNYAFQEESMLQAFKLIVGCVADGGRLIMGFYPNNKEERVYDLKKLDRLKELGFSNLVLRENPDSNAFLVWWDKS